MTQSKPGDPTRRDISAELPPPEKLEQPTPFVQANEPGELARLSPEEATRKADRQMSRILRLASA